MTQDTTLLSRITRYLRAHAPSDRASLALLVLAVGLHLGVDVIASYQSPLESNPLVLALGWQTWVVAKIALSAGLVGAWIVGREHWSAGYVAGLGVVSALPATANLLVLGSGPTGTVAAGLSVGVVVVAVGVRSQSSVVDVLKGLRTVRSEHGDVLRAVAFSLILVFSVISPWVGFVSLSSQSAKAIDQTDNWTIEAEDSGSVRRYDGIPSTENKTWEVSIDDGINDIAVDKKGGFVYVITRPVDTNKVFRAIDLSTGNVEWSLTESTSYFDIYFDESGIYMEKSGSGAIKYDKSGNQIWVNNQTGAKSTVVLSSKGVWLHDGDGEIYLLDKMDGSTIANKTINSSEALGGHGHPNAGAVFAESDRFVQYYEDGGNIYQGSISNEISQNTIYKTDVEVYDGDFYISGEYNGNNRIIKTGPSFNVEWAKDYANTPTLSATSNDTLIVPGSTSRELSFSDGSEINSFSGSQFVISEGEFTQSSSDTSGGSDISGTVTDQNGNPIKNATVAIYGVDHSAINPDSGQSKVERANELLDDTRDPTPPEYDSDLSVTGSGGVLATTDDPVPLIHTDEQWGFAGGFWDDPQLEQPLVHAPAEEPIVVSVWRPGSSAAEDGVDNDIPGYVTAKNESANQLIGLLGSDNTEEGLPSVSIEQLGPSGDVLNTYNFTVRKEYAAGIGGGPHLYQEMTLPVGFYRVSVEGSDVSYIVEVGKAEERWGAWAQNVTDNANKKIERANEIQQLINDGKLARQTVTTDANGKFTADVGSNIKTVGMHAYRLDGQTLPSSSDQSIQTVREYVEDPDYTGSVFIAPSTTKDVPANNVTLRGYQAGSSMWANATKFGDRWDKIQDIIDTGSYADLVSLFGDIPSEQSRDELEQRAQELDRLRDNNQQLRNHVRDLQDELREEEDITVEEARRVLSEANATNLTDSELETRVAALEQALAEAQDGMDTDPPETSAGPETISQTHTFSGELLKEQTTVVVRFANGTSTLMSDEYWRINSRAAVGDEVVIENYPIPDGSAVANVRVVTVSEEGDLGRSAASQRNPRYSGQLPQIESVDVSSLRPGPQDRVDVTLNPAADSQLSLDSATVYLDGSQVATPTISNDKSFDFQTSGEGQYLLELEMTDSSGSMFVERVPIRAGTSNVPMPPGVRIQQGTLGTYAVAGDGLAGAGVTVADSGRALTVTPVVQDGSDAPSEVHVYQEGVQTAPESDTTVRVVEGSADGPAVQQHLKVVVHGSDVDEGATVYRSGKRPIATDGQTPYGNLSRHGGTATITTYTDADGSVTVTIDNEPNFLESQLYDLRVSTGLDLSQLPALIRAPVAPQSTAAVLGGEAHG